MRRYDGSNRDPEARKRWSQVLAGITFLGIAFEVILILIMIGVAVYPSFTGEERKLFHLVLAYTVVGVLFAMIIGVFLAPLEYDVRKRLRWLKARCR